MRIKSNLLEKNESINSVKFKYITLTQDLGKTPTKLY